MDPVDAKSILFKSLWENNERSLMLITFLRRFGWSLCRMGALDLSENVNLLNEKYPNIIGAAAIGLANLDYEDFVKGNYFNIGKIYIDKKKATYESLDLEKMTFLSGFGMLDPRVYMYGYKASKKGISGNMKGDGFQLGGTFIVDKKGNIIFSYVQQSYTDHPTFENLKKSIEDYSKRL